MRVRRVDTETISGVQRTPQNGVRVPATLSRIGCQSYSDGARSWVEYRPADEVFRADALASLRAAPVTVGHPSHLVDAKTWRSDAVGHTCDDVRQDGSMVAATLVIQDAPTVEAVLSKALREISVGYECDIDSTPGIAPDGTRYDAIQRNISANHVALLPQGAGRAGPDVRLRFDGAAVQVRDAETPPANASAANESSVPTLVRAGREVRADGAQKEPIAMKIKINGKEFDLRNDADAAAAQAAVDAGGNELAGVKAALMDALQKCAALEAKQAAAAAATPPVAAAPDAAEMSDEVLDAEYEKRGLRARKDAFNATVKAYEVDASKLKTDEAKRAVVAKAFPSVKLDGQDAKSIDFLFAAAGDLKKSAPANDTKRNDALGAANAAAVGANENGEPEARTDAADPEESMVKSREAQAKAARERAMR